MTDSPGTASASNFVEPEGQRLGALADFIGVRANHASAGISSQRSSSHRRKVSSSA